MYAGSLFKQMHNLDRWFGTHQKIDRLAYRELERASVGIQIADFPDITDILKFEGRDGPDGIKTKTPGQDEPWHFFDPYDKKDTKLPKILEQHFDNLVKALQKDDKTRASFESAWLAHAVVDGLTPAHQYPYEQELEKLRGGANKESRNTPKGKLVIPGDTTKERLRNNWHMWGDKGLLATHLAFEMGVALIILPMRLRKFTVRRALLKKYGNREKYLKFYIVQAKRVADMKLYEQFYKAGWMPSFATRVRKELVPVLVETVAVIWYAARAEADMKGAK